MRKPHQGMKTNVATIATFALGLAVSQGWIDPETDIAKLATAITLVGTAVAGLMFRHFGTVREDEARIDATQWRSIAETSQRGLDALAAEEKAGRNGS